MFESACLFETSIGTCGIAWTAIGLTAVQLPEASMGATRARLLRHGAALVSRAEAPPEVCEALGLLAGFLAESVVSLSQVRLDMFRASAFEQQVYAALREVGWGETVTYGGLALATGCDGAARAVGAAMARNAWPLVVPCHRVLASDGRLGGFSAPGGTVTKAALLAREGIFVDGGQRSLFQ